ncbi:MAG: lipoyl(octanoyl) transferase LipB [Ectothiorhodospiraceae bacterium]|nr:lipoyl(octanoyl) transferase LipB [Ectothiorhodospiraceae bacterium]
MTGFTPPRIRNLGLADYRRTWLAMQDFTEQRDSTTEDELWVMEHPSVFTQGLNGKPEHLLAPGDIPVVPVDRGGQVTYHGPGQLVVYVLLDLRRRGLGIRRLVSILEHGVVSLAADYGIQAYPRPDAPGVYVDDAKLASVGLRVRRGCSYHGLSLNVDMDLAPFSRINPCGYQGLRVTQLRDLGVGDELQVISQRLLSELTALLADNGATLAGTAAAPATSVP